MNTNKLATLCAALRDDYDDLERLFVTRAIDDRLAEIGAAYLGRPAPLHVEAITGWEIVSNSKYLGRK